MKLLRFTSKLLSIALVTLLFIKVSQEAAIPPRSSSGVENVSESEGKTIEVTGEPSFISSETTCSVCLDDLHNNKEKGPIVTLEPCDHSFHRACADNWLQTEGTCPLCRSEYGHSEFKYKEDPTPYHVIGKGSPSIVPFNPEDIGRFQRLMNNMRGVVNSRDLSHLIQNAEQHNPLYQDVMGQIEHWFERLDEVDRVFLRDRIDFMPLMLI
ncbi:uncharacterized protein PGTG_16615 [Puccinia graminis f. sp. tritici CRL 75-36-700-3]|uniref:RING-type domain-containing protein n=1 Tax=Puccinia graminis f. sp. tritici (strain CRL 75-36-700-3 / race SCCL) TaxID=418459 RepID=E3L214_PUCGT|nr:uncharacterized protein PGTG_16615 [Puccinia graminis f. sp. tritici CRL 75-36-700-3]EFP90589.2 hypothetical protein PGTG_16615 [Puccinia graminis f. sp. tritici CRL 75-36-700-3]